MKTAIKKTNSKFARFSIAILFAMPVLISFNSSTDGSYLLQAISGHFRIMCSREPIEKILKENLIGIESRNKLKLALNVREFASKELGLPRNKSYTVYSEITGKYPGWNVYCAPEFSVEPKKWCFPVAGCVVYRGYFSKEKALAFADKMKAKNFDVFVGPFTAYSTLGWYNDPLLSNHLLLDSIHLAGLIIHELAHQKVYVKGDSRFNEGFAVTVERAGVLKWLKFIGRDDQMARAINAWESEDDKVAKILSARSQLKDIYQRDPDRGSLSQKKDSIFRVLKIDLSTGNSTGVKLPKTDSPDMELNNAYLAPVNVYYSLVPMFRTLLDSCSGNFPLFYKKAEELGKLSSGDRQGKN